MPFVTSSSLFLVVMLGANMLHRIRTGSLQSLWRPTAEVDRMQDLAAAQQQVPP